MINDLISRSALLEKSHPLTPCTVDNPYNTASVVDVEDILSAPVVDFVNRKLYYSLLDDFNELLDDFTDYVCSGVNNPAQYCANACTECVDRHGWCSGSGDVCKGFYPKICIERKTE